MTLPFFDWIKRFIAIKIEPIISEPMKISRNGINLIKQFETVHDGEKNIPGLQPQMDPVGIWTEGYGRAMRDDRGNFLIGAKNKSLAYLRATIINEQQAEIALIEDTARFEYLVKRNISVELSQNQFDALVSYAYNTGGSSTLYRLINTKAPKAEIKNWIEEHYITANGKRLNGLIRRRKAESDLYFSELI